MVSLVERIDEDIFVFVAGIDSILERTEAVLIKIIPGFGKVNGTVVAAEVGDPNRFERPNQLTAYAGIDSPKTQSGRFECSEKHVLKRGSSHLRYALFNAADIVWQHDSYFGDYYKTKPAKGKHHYVALSGVARKLCGVILAVLQEQWPYVPC